jgi:DNA-binding LacI/PurR family transcriptional regulator
VTKVSLQHIATRLGVSVKTVSGALHDSSIRMSHDTRERIRALADELGYVPNIMARGMRQGVMPFVGLIADGLITQPFATEIMRSLDNTLRPNGLSLIATSVGGARSAEAGVSEVERLMPRAIAYASMYHYVVALPAAVRRSIALMINCREETGEVPALVPAERQAAEKIVGHLFARGRRRIAFLNLPGLVAGQLREEGFRRAHAEQDAPIIEDWIRPATRGPIYNDLARSLVAMRVGEIMRGSARPDAILCGNDRVAMEVFSALRREGASIPDDVAVASFDNQIDIATRLDPPLTTMELPHRAMGRRAGEILAGLKAAPEQIEEIPFRLVERASV